LQRRWRSAALRESGATSKPDSPHCVAWFALT
jgi:hypothetical protein